MFIFGLNHDLYISSAAPANSGPVQTVSAGTFSGFHRLIPLFAEKTGVPVLLDKSFDLNGGRQ